MYTMVPAASSTKVHKKDAMDFHMDGEDLAHARFRVLMAQYEAEHGRGWQLKLASKAGVTRGMISQIARGEKEAGMKVVTGAARGLDIAESFFFDKSLGKSPNYRDFIGKKPARVAGVAESRIDRDPIDESSMDQWTVFTYTDEYKGASEEAKAHAHTLRNQGLDLSVKQYIGVVESLDALRKGKGIPEHKIETPIGETRMRLGRKGR